MGTYLKIAPQNSDVVFSTVNTTVITSSNIETTTLSVGTTGSGYFEGTFSGSFIGTISGSTDLDFVTPFYVTASKGYLSYVNNGSFTLVSTGSVSHMFLIQDSTGSAFKVNGEGVTQLKVFTGSAPTAVTGGIYFTSTDMYIGI